MANILDRLTLGEGWLLRIDGDPSQGSGVDAPIGSYAQWDDNNVGKQYIKVGVDPTQWDRMAEYSYVAAREAAVRADFAAADAAIQSELDTTQAGAGLEMSGAYSANSSAHYISQATSLKDADNKLDAALKVEELARSTEDADIRLDFAAADAAIQSELDVTQAGAGLEASGAYSANGSANYISTASSLKDADNKLDAALKVEELARIAEDASLQSDLDDLDAYAQEIRSDLDDLDAYAQEIRSDLDQEVSDRIADVNAEESARIAADAAIQSELDATQAGAGLEASGAYSANSSANYISQATSLKDADNKLDAALKAEANRLDGRIDTQKARIDAILDASDADYDSFAEIVSLINSVDTTNDQAFAGYVSTNNARVSAIELELDTTQAGAGLEASGAYSANSSANYISQATSLKDADNKLDAALKVEELARIAADAAIQSELDVTQAGAGLEMSGAYSSNSSAHYIAEATSLKDADNKLDAALWQEAADRALEDETFLKLDGSRAMEDSLDMDSNKIINLADGVDEKDAVNLSQLDAAIEAEELARSTEDADIRADFAAADAAIQSELDTTQAGAGLEMSGAYSANSSAHYIAEATSLKDADNKLDAALKAEELARIDEDADIRVDFAAADAAIQSELDTTQAGAGLEMSGAYSANALANYISTASSLKDADNKLDAALKVEVTRLDGRIDSVLDNIDPAALDSLREVVDAFQNADSDIYDAISGLSGTLSQEIEAESDRAKAREDELEEMIEAEALARVAEDLTFVKTDGSRPMSSLDVTGDVKVSGQGTVFEFAADSEYKMSQASALTTDATVTTLQFIQVPLNSMVHVRTTVLAKKKTGPGIGDGAVYVKEARFKNINGVVTMHTLQSSYTSEDILGLNAIMDSDQTSGRVRVTGLSATEMDWESTTEVTVLR